MEQQQGNIGKISIERDFHSLWNGIPIPCDPPGAAEGFSSVLVFPCSPGKQPQFPGNSKSLSQESSPEGPASP